MSHINKVAATTGKVFFLITHSPFFIELKQPESLLSIICFHADFRAPSSFNEMSLINNDKLSFLLTRINTHHKQLFFADYPIFVEGIFDAQIFSAIQERRNVSMAGAGACFIDVGGKEELIQYYQLAKAFGKSARYILDLDALFDRSLRSSAGSDETIVETLVDTGLGASLTEAIGQLEKVLDRIINIIESAQSTVDGIANLKKFLAQAKNKGEKLNQAKKRVAVLIQAEIDADAFNGLVENIVIRDTLAKRNQILCSLNNGGIQLLRRGFLENYLPGYTASIFAAAESQKRNSVAKEVKFLSDQTNSLEVLRTRYSGLFDVLEKLPSANDADFEKSIKLHLSTVIFEIQRGVYDAKIESISDVADCLGSIWANTQRVFELKEINFKKQEKIEGFAGVIIVKDFWGLGEKLVKFDHNTNTGNFQNLILEEMPTKMD